MTSIQKKKDNRKKNILIVNGYLDIGGAERVLTLLANSLCTSFNVYFVILEDSKTQLFELSKKVEVIRLNIEIERKSASEMGFFKAISYYNYCANKISTLATELSIDLVIAFNDREVFLCWLAFRRRRDIKLLFSQRNAPSSKPFRINEALRYIYRKCDCAVFQLEQVRAFYGLEESSKAFIIENPIKIPLKLYVPNEREHKIIGVGRLVDQKRFDVLIYAFKIFHSSHPDYVLDIYGKGPNQRKLEELVRTLELTKYVDILSPIPNVMENNKNAKMFVLSSDYEGIPNVVIEAMASGIPCITTNCLPGGGKLVSNNGKCALLVETGNPQALADAMDLYANNDELVKNNTEKSFLYIDRFSENIVFKKWFNVINGLLN